MKPILVTTEFRGVFFGYLDHDPTDLPNSIKLKNARNCVYWAHSTHGFLGLAATGPNNECRIGPKVEELELWKITSITPVTPEAVEKWEAAPWS